MGKRLTLALKGRRSGDEGVAIVVALLVTVIAFLLMTAILAQSLHNIVQSGYGRKRLSAVSAAEAGLNWYANRVARTSLTVISTPTFGWTRDAKGWYVRKPEAASGHPDRAEFQVKVRYSTTSPCTNAQDLSTCALSHLSDPMLLSRYVGANPDPFPNPVYAVVRSIGIVDMEGSPSPGEIGTGSVQRVLEEYVRLRAGTTVVAGGISAISLCLGSGAKISVYGDLAINNETAARANLAPFVANCPLTNDTGNIVIDGGKYLRTVPWSPAFAQGDLLIKGGGLVVQPTKHVEIAGDLWVEGEIGFGCTGGVSCVKPSSPCASSGTIQCVQGDAYGTGIYQGPYGHIVGQQTICSPACPPEANFTEIRWDPAQWQDWTVLSGTASSLSSMIQAARTPTVIHLSGTNCRVTMPSGQVKLYTSVAVVSECGYLFDPPGTTLIRQPSSCTNCSLLVLSVVPSDLTLDQINCGDASANWTTPGPRDIRVKGNQNFGGLDQPGPGLFLYTPCYLWIEGNQCQGCTEDPSPDDVITDPNDPTKTKKSNSANEAPIQGQFIARYMILKNGVRLIQNDIGDYLTYLPGLVSSFEQDVKFVREITVSALLNNL